jgi:hypothetical protein
MTRLPGFTAEASTYRSIGRPKAFVPSSRDALVRPAYYYEETMEACLGRCSNNYKNCVRMRSEGYCLGQRNSCVADCAFRG